MICIGEIVNTHGLKGEVKVVSYFKYKEAAFKKGSYIFIGEQKEKLKIKTHRIQKNFDLLSFENHESINDVLAYKGEFIFIIREDLEEEFINEDLLGYDVVYDDEVIGSVANLFNNNAHDIMIVKNGSKKYLIPCVNSFFKKVDKTKKQIQLEKTEGIINENWYINLISRNDHRDD